VELPGDAGLEAFSLLGGDACPAPAPRPASPTLVRAFRHQAQLSL